MQRASLLARDAVDVISIAVKSEGAVRALGDF
jgi:hypothetical protein